MILYRHVIREHAFPFAFSLAILVFISVMQYAIQILDQIISRGLDASVVLEIFVINLGWIIALAIPMAVLTSTLMAFGRMSADNEILTIKASGLNLYHLIMPVMVAATVMCVLLVFFNNLVLPDANHRTANLMSDISRKRPAAFLEPGVLVRDFENYAIYVSAVDPRSGKLEGIKIFSDVPGEGPATTVADSGEVRQTADGGFLRLSLYSGETHSVDVKNSKQYFVGRFGRQVLLIRNVDSGLRRTNSSYRGDREKSVPMMMQDINRAKAARGSCIAEFDASLDTVLSSVASLESLAVNEKGAADAKIDSARAFASWAAALAPAKRAAAAALRREQSTMERLGSRIRAQEMTISQYMVEVHKKFSIPVACIVFVLIGAPLGIMAKRGGLTIGASYSIFFFILYWAFVIQGENLADRMIISPFLAMWSANILIGVCGIVLLVRMIRETTFISFAPLVRAWHGATARFRGTGAGRGVAFVVDIPGRVAGAPLWLVRKVAGILPIYLIRIFLGYVFGIFIAILVVFVVVDYISNANRFSNVPFHDVARFYWYYLPWVLQLVFPIVMLLASMFAMGRLAKNSELIAMRAAGKSIRIVTMPLLLLGVLIVGLNFYFSERVLPFANVKRMKLLNDMQEGRQPSARSYRDFRRNFYYFGNSRTIYGFEEFGTRPQRTRNVWRERFDANRIVERVQAQRSVYENGKWHFVNGSVRRFMGDSSSVLNFDTLRDTILTATPEEMVVYIKSPEEMSYWELRDFIGKAQRRGEEVRKYLTELDFKIAYPFMNFIVILLGIAVTARTGKTGGAVLLGIGLLLVFSYWILARFALSFGKSGEIAPLVGAWLGNAVFFLVGLLLYRKADQ